MKQLGLILALIALSVEVKAQHIFLSLEDLQSPIRKFVMEQTYSGKPDAPLHWKSLSAWEELTPKFLQQRSFQETEPEANLTTAAEAKVLLNYLAREDFNDYNFNELEDFLTMRFEKLPHKYFLFQIHENQRAVYNALKKFDIQTQGETDYHYRAALIYLQHVRSFNIPVALDLFSNFFSGLKKSIYRTTILQDLISTLIAKAPEDLDRFLTLKFVLESNPIGAKKTFLEHIVSIAKTPNADFDLPKLDKVIFLANRQLSIMDHIYQAEKDLHRKITQIKEMKFFIGEILSLMKERNRMVPAFAQRNTALAQEDRTIRAQINKRNEANTFNEVLTLFTKFVEQKTHVNSSPMTFADSRVTFTKENIEVKTKSKLVFFKAQPKTLAVVSATVQNYGQITFEVEHFISLVDYVPALDGILLPYEIRQEIPAGFVQVRTTDKNYLIIRTQKLEELEATQNTTFIRESKKELTTPPVYQVLENVYQPAVEPITIQRPEVKTYMNLLRSDIHTSKLQSLTIGQTTVELNQNLSYDLSTLTNPPPGILNFPKLRTKLKTRQDETEVPSKDLLKILEVRVIREGPDTTLVLTEIFRRATDPSIDLPRFDGIFIENRIPQDLISEDLSGVSVKGGYVIIPRNALKLCQNLFE